MTEQLRSREVEALIVAVEDLLERRRREMLEQTPKRRYREERRVSDTPTKFTWEELYDHYPPFREIRKQRKRPYKRPPPREDIVKLARTYQCDLPELNVLLTAAGYAQEVLYLEGEELEHALNHIETIIHYLPLPGYVVTRDLNIHRWNDGTPKLFNISHEELKSTPTQERNVLRFIFDPGTPVYKVLTGNMEWWEYTAWLNVYRFKKENLLCQFDDWYISTYAFLRQFPRFDEFWDTTQIGVGFKKYSSPKDHPTYETEIFTPEGERIRVRGLSVFDTNDDYPRAILYIPADTASAEVLTTYGFPTSQNWWGFKSVE
jgi:PAS domain-containing protein